MATPIDSYVLTKSAELRLVTCSVSRFATDHLHCGPNIPRSVAIVANAIPAIRSSGIDPMNALKYE
jgi:hypothetical protein